MDRLLLAIETSNPPPPGQADRSAQPGADRAVGGDGPGVALARVSIDHSGPIELVDREPVAAAHRRDDLMPAIERLCRRAGVTPGAIQQVAVSVGPGGFTSVRIAVIAGKLIAEAVGARCVAVPTALALIRRVAQSSSRPQSITIALAWKRTDAWVTRFHAPVGGSVPVALGPGGLEPFESVVGADPSGILVADEALTALLRDRGLLNPTTAHQTPCYDPLAVAEAASGLADCDPMELSPLYPREPEAVTKWRALKGTA